MSPLSGKTGWFARFRGLRLVRQDFDEGGKTLISYLTTHRMRYNRHVGAHFLIALDAQGPGQMQAFADKQRLYGWHFDLSPSEQVALRLARDATCTGTKIANLRYGTNVFLQLANPRQLGRMLALGAVAGSAGVLLALGEVFLFAKEATRALLENRFGITFASATARDKAEFVALAEQVTAGAVTAGGDLDADIVADRIADLVRTIEAAGSAQAAVNVASRDWSYVVGVLSGIVFLVIGRGLIKLVVEGLTGTVTKIDGLIEDMDAWCDWRLGRAPYPPEQPHLAGDLLHPTGRRIERP